MVVIRIARAATTTTRTTIARKTIQPSHSTDRTPPELPAAPDHEPATEGPKPCMAADALRHRRSDTTSGLQESNLLCQAPPPEKRNQRRADARRGRARRRPAILD